MIRRKPEVGGEEPNLPTYIGGEADMWNKMNLGVIKMLQYPTTLDKGELFMSLILTLEVVIVIMVLSYRKNVREYVKEWRSKYEESNGQLETTREERKKKEQEVKVEARRLWVRKTLVNLVVNLMLTTILIIIFLGPEGNPILQYLVVFLLTGLFMPLYNNVVKLKSDDTTGKDYNYLTIKIMAVIFLTLLTALTLL